MIFRVGSTLSFPSGPNLLCAMPMKISGFASHCTRSTDGPVVFRRGEEQRIRSEYLVAQPRHRSRETLLLDVEVVDRKLGDAGDPELESGWHQLARRLERHHVVGFLPEAAADA